MNKITIQITGFDSIKMIVDVIKEILLENSDLNFYTMEKLIGLKNSEFFSSEEESGSILEIPKIPICSMCGTRFTTIHNMHRHQDSTCPKGRIKWERKRYHKKQKEELNRQLGIF